MHKMALGGNLHFFVLINGMSFVQVGVRTEEEAYIYMVCGPFCFISQPVMVSWVGGSLSTAMSFHCRDCAIEAGGSQAFFHVRRAEPE